MDRRPVRSSNVASVGYDESSSTLEVEFHGGRVIDISESQNNISSL